MRWPVSANTQRNAAATSSLHSPHPRPPTPHPLPHPSPLFNEDSTPKWREPQTKTYLPPFPTHLSLSLRLLLETMSTLSGTSWEGKKYRVFRILVSPFRRLSRPQLHTAAYVVCNCDDAKAGKSRAKPKQSAPRKFLNSTLST